MKLKKSTEVEDPNTKKGLHFAHVYTYVIIVEPLLKGTSERRTPLSLSLSLSLIRTPFLSPRTVNLTPEIRTSH